MFSFLNVIVYRVPRHMSFIKGFSACPSCGHRLGAADLVPVFGYLFLKGRCRYCGQKIGIRDTLTELLGGGAALLCASWFPEPAAAFTAFGFFSVLVVTALLDADTMEIPDGCWSALAALAVVSYFTMDGEPLVSRLIGMACISVPMFLMALLIDGAFGGRGYKADGRRGAVSGLETYAGIRGSCHIAGRRIWDLFAADREKGTERAFRFWAVFVYGNGCRAFVGTAAD